MTDVVLTLNAGSSSLKFALFAVTEDSLNATVRGQLEGVGTAPSRRQGR